MSELYLIEELWTNSLENALERARGYSVVGYVVSEETAKQIVSDAGIAPANGWPLSEPTPRKKYRAITHIEFIAAGDPPASHQTAGGPPGDEIATQRGGSGGAIEAAHCEECGNDIPMVAGGGLVNRHHKPSCSLYDESEP